MNDRKEVKDYNKDKRGEGIYPAAFEGLIRNVSAAIRKPFPNIESGIQPVYAPHTV